MNKYTIQSTDQNGELIKESILEIEQGDKIIVKVGWLDDKQTKPAPKQLIDYFHRQISEHLESEDKVLTIPSFVELQVLKIK